MRRRRFRRRSYRGVSALVLLLVVALVAWLRSSEPQTPEALAEGDYDVARVVDGDTLLLTNGAYVRLIGVDTPETVHPNRPVEPWGPEATRFSQQFLAKGRIRLRFDDERIDRYDRFLAYVYVGEQMLNEELIRAGLGRANLDYRFASSMKTRFERAQREAQLADRGIWSQ
jgi:micrococcal nuclease